VFLNKTDVNLSGGLDAAGNTFAVHFNVGGPPAGRDAMTPVHGWGTVCDCVGAFPATLGAITTPAQPLAWLDARQRSSGCRRCELRADGRENVLAAMIGACAPARPLARLITTPIYYATAPPHIGHLYSSLLADFAARVTRAADCGARVAMVTGTDEHGSKIAQAAAAAGVQPQAFVDGVAQRYRAAHAAFAVVPDTFVRTTRREHVETVQWLWRRLASRGAIRAGRHEGWYCVSDEAFVPPAGVTSRAAYAAARGLPPPPTPEAAAVQVSAESGHPVTWTAEDGWVFELGAYTAGVDAWLRTANPIHPPARGEEVGGWLAAQADDAGGVGRLLSVSRPRDRVPWGIPVPGDDRQTVYVWLDALANYLTAARSPTAALDDGRPLPSLPPPDVSAGEAAAAFPGWRDVVHIVGKDILRFHAYYWPAFLLAAQLPLPSRIVAHGHWTVGRQKMSKSLGNIVDPLQLLRPPPDGAGLTVDAVRYVLLREGSLAADGDFSPATLHHRCEAECANTLGNLVTRVLTAKFLPGGRLPAAALVDVPADPHAATLASAARDAARDAVAAADTPSLYLQHVMALLAAANAAFANAAPWSLLKPAAGGDAAAGARLSSVLYAVVEALRVAAVLLHPVTPAAAEAILTRLGVQPDAADQHGRPVYALARAVFGLRPPGEVAIEVGVPPPQLFPRPMAPTPLAGGGGDGGGRGGAAAVGKGRK
jgi:methionyl-tRNA synthetase